MTETTDENEINALNIAAHLEGVAQKIREGHIVGLEYKWGGGKEVTLAVSLAEPLNFIPITMHLVDLMDKGETDEDL
ncbi:MAG TPA: hypothetical protein VM366_16005 [Anaerolineae bacterium]|nr:hypothetical protein [Anaerolineae bacterium]